MSLSKTYWEFEAMLASYKADMAAKDMPTISELQVLKELQEKNDLLKMIIDLKEEIAALMEQPGNGRLIDRKILEMERLVEKL